MIQSHSCGWSRSPITTAWLLDRAGGRKPGSDWQQESPWEKEVGRATVGSSAMAQSQPCSVLRRPHDSAPSVLHPVDGPRTQRSQNQRGPLAHSQLPPRRACNEEEQGRERLGKREMLFRPRKRTRDILAEDRASAWTLH